MKTKIIIIGPGYWGSGFSLAEAIANYRKSAGIRRKTPSETVTAYAFIPTEECIPFDPDSPYSHVDDLVTVKRSSLAERREWLSGAHDGTPEAIGDHCDAWVTNGSINWCNCLRVELGEFKV